MSTKYTLTKEVIYVKEVEISDEIENADPDTRWDWLADQFASMTEDDIKDVYIMDDKIEGDE